MFHWIAFLGFALDLLHDSLIRLPKIQCHPHDSVLHVTNALHCSVTTGLDDVAVRVGQQLIAAGEALSVERTVSTNGSVVCGLEGVDLVRRHAAL